MIFFGRWHITIRNAVLLWVVIVIVVILFGGVVLALVAPLVTTDYQFLTVPTLTPVFP